MIKIIFSALLLTITSQGFSQNTSCKDFQTGVFQFEGNSGEFYTILRTDSTQIEKSTRAAQHSKMKITWTSNCMYLLSDRTVYKWGQQPEKDNSNIILKNKVYKFEKPNKFYVETFVDGYPDTVKTVFYKLDTTKYYDDALSLSSYRDYKNSTTYGENLFDEIYSKNYYKSNQNPTKFLLLFETSYEIEKRQRNVILDQRIISIRKNEKIITSDCSFDEKNSNDLLVVYSQRTINSKPKIVRAFRFNTLSKKIEEVDSKRVECTVSIKTKIGD